MAILPGRPVLLAVVDGKPVVGLPGYPLSCMLTAKLFLQELLWKFQRRTPALRQWTRAKLTEKVESRFGVEEFVRIILTPGNPYPTAAALPRGASLISTLTQANAWLRIAPDCSELDADTLVEVELF